jgi:hypothetical protein
LDPAGEYVSIEPVIIQERALSHNESNPNIHQMKIVTIKGKEENYPSFYQNKKRNILLLFYPPASYRLKKRGEFR